MYHNSCRPHLTNRTHNCVHGVDPDDLETHVPQLIPHCGHYYPHGLYSLQTPWYE